VVLTESLIVGLGVASRALTRGVGSTVDRRLRGFPESHAANFGLLVYASSWLKCHEPEVVLAAMLNRQPMGFYSPSRLVQDAQRHRVKVLQVCHDKRPGLVA
jgi:hypothetical protein